MRFHRTLAAVACVNWLAALGLAHAGDAFPPADVQALTQIAVKGMAEEHQPGLVVGIWIPGRGAFVQAFGKADLASGAPMDLDDHFRIASITKTFTATAVLRLVDQGKLRLDDTLSTYIAGIPNGDRITIRNLLAMTSGIYDFTMDEQFDKAFAGNPVMSFGLDDLLAILRRPSAGVRAGHEGFLLRHELLAPRCDHREGDG